MFLRRKKTMMFYGSIFISTCLIHTLRLLVHVYSSRQVKVLILTYMRSGSSLTGDILQHNQESFYVYEPLRSFCPSFCSSVISSNLMYANGTKRWAPILFTEEAYSTFYKWFSCDISKLPTVTLYDVFLEKGLKTNMFIPCYNNASLSTLNHAYAMHKCTRELQDVCQESPIRIIKTIRSNLSDVKHLLEDLPDLKIIHIVRDPRATLYSQSHLGMCTLINDGRYRCSNRLCQRLENDINESEILSKRYPNRIMTLRYENLARYPLETSQKMYDFIGVEMTQETKMFVYNKTMAGNKDDCSICSTRSNSSAHVDSWKQNMDSEFLSIVNKRCDYVIKRLRYDEYPTK